MAFARLARMRVLALVHQRDAGPGVFAEAVRARGAGLDEWCLAEEPEPPADPLGYDAVFTLGGAMHADKEERHRWIAEEKALLRELLEARCRCSGSASAPRCWPRQRGRSRAARGDPEIGWFQVEATPEGAEDPLLGPLSPEFEAFEWHSYEVPLPPGAVPLARSEVCLRPPASASSPGPSSSIPRSAAPTPCLGRGVPLRPRCDPDRHRPGAARAGDRREDRRLQHPRTRAVQALARSQSTWLGVR